MSRALAFPLRSCLPLALGLAIRGRGGDRGDALVEHGHGIFAKERRQP